MFTIEFDKSDIEANVKDFEKIPQDIDKEIEKAVRWYINQVYASLYKQHSRPYTYGTPPLLERSVLRKRSGGLLSELKNNRFVRKSDDKTWETGWLIPRGSYLFVHAGNPGEKTVIRARGEYMVIPLRAALNADGTPKKMSPRQWVGLKKYRVGNIRARIDFSGENAAKFHDNTWILAKPIGVAYSGARRYIPYYILARQVTIRKRLFIQQRMEDYYDELYNRLDTVIARRLGKRGGIT
jgi:hypothetical protein